MTIFILRNTNTLHFHRNLLYRWNTYRRYVSTWSPLAVAFNTKPKEKFTVFSESPGLFNYPILSSTDGFDILKERTIRRTRELLKECCDEKRDRKLVQVFDELSDTICKAADLSEFVRMMHPEMGYNEVAENVCVIMSGVVEKLNTNKQLFDSIKKVSVEGDKFPMTKEEKHIIDLFIFDFEQCGIHLPDKERNLVVYYNDCILQLGQKFMSRASTPRTVDKDSVPSTLYQYFSIDNDDKLIVTGYSDVDDEYCREIAYKIYLAPGPEQEQLLDEILEYRQKLAKICGFPTYAHRAMRGSTAETPEFVLEFLNALNSNLRDRVNADFNLMRNSKLSESKREFGMWDVPYYSAKIKRQWLKLHPNDYCPYFSLGACMEGINYLFNKLFSISLVEEPAEPSELWCTSVYKLAVVHDVEGHLGYIYCDFYERPEKPHQDCHFTIRGGRRLANGSYQDPIVVVVLNLPVPCGPIPSLLTPSMVENLFHEMGHAIHSMLGRANYQHVTGTRCATDFAEVPSVLMEYFSSDPRVLKTFAKHYKTGEPMPDVMLERLCNSRHWFSASELQGQVFYSALDHYYHTRDDAPGQTTKILAEVQSLYYPLPHVEYTAWHLKFSHLIGYGAKYYSYLMSRAIASSIWQKFFKDDPFNRKMGQKYRQECLAHGGGKPPRLLVKDLLNQEITAKELTNSLVREVDNSYEKIS